MAIKKSSSSGIPSGNNAGRPASPGIGQLYSNGEAARLELWTQASGWQNIIQETPGVASITGNYLESTNSGVITISGTNFVSGAYATAIGTNGVQIDAASTTFNSLVQLTATFTGLVSANEPYDIKVTNPSNLFGMLPDALYVNNNPAWTTPAGSLGSFAEQVNATIYALSVSDESTITYSLAAGSSLPSGVTLSSAGVISGTLPDVASNTTYTFTVNATDGLNPLISRTFSFISNAAPVWVTSSGSLGGYWNNTNISTPALSVTDNDNLTYALASGSSLPSGLTLNPSTGVISGLLPAVGTNTNYSFTINVIDGINIVARSFSIDSIASLSIDYLIVAGGGGSGWQRRGGGGAGGMLTGTISNLARNTTQLITVGNGGSANQSNQTTHTPGANSVLSNITAIGGGSGGLDTGTVPLQNGSAGGSGGGGLAENGSNGFGGAGTSGQGHAGGSGNGAGSNQHGAGGGGGAAAVGGNGSSSAPGNGGNGLQSSITGTLTYYAGGGGGGYYSGTTGYRSSGGLGGGGMGASSTVAAESGAANTGGGGGGGWNGNQNINGGAGGSGVVVIAYPNTNPDLSNIPGALTYDQPTRAGYKVYRFTAGSGTITI